MQITDELIGYIGDLSRLYLSDEEKERAKKDLSDVDVYKRQGVNGSGKHTNWSISTDTGIGLLDPGKKPEENTIFLITLAAVIQAADEYQDLLRAVSYTHLDVYKRQDRSLCERNR